MSLSRSSSFSEEELKALGLWNISEQFGRKKSVTEQPSSLTVDEIETMQKQAYDEAFAQGKQEGFEQGFEEGKQAGYNQGFETGKLEGEKKGYEENLHLIRKQTAEFVSLLESLSEPFNELDEIVEEQLADLAITIANQIVRREIKINPEQIISIIHDAISVLPVASQRLTLSMHPDDAELVRTSLALDDISPPWIIIEDHLLTRGGCKVETETSRIDVTVEHRVATIFSTVLGGERGEDVEP